MFRRPGDSAPRRGSEPRAPPCPSLSSETPLVEGIVRWWQARIDDRIVRLGTRLPSIRHFAAEQRVSRHTVVEAYERLADLGYVQARRGSGFYVQRARPEPGPRSRPAPAATSIDIAWLLRNLFRDLPPDNMPGGGLFPPAWLDGALVSRHARGVTLTAGSDLAGLRRAPGLPAAAPATLAEAGRAGDSGRAGADRHHGRRHPRRGPGRAALPAAR